MAELTEREYVIPLRKAFLKVPGYRRAGKAARAIKIFIAKHMKVPERDIGKVKVDMYLNNEVWYRGKTNPPSKIKVKAIREGDIVKVEFVESPEHVKFLKAKHAKLHKEVEKEEKKEEVKPEQKPTAEEKKEEAETKIDEKEKEKALETEQIKSAKKEKLATKHVTKIKEAEIKRTSMNRH